MCFVIKTRPLHRLNLFVWCVCRLIGFVLAPLFCGASVYQMSPIDFIRRPWVWLKAMSDYKCVCCAAPNFAFDLVCRKMPDQVYDSLDLSHVTGILSGAEPVRKQTIDAFLQVRLHSTTSRKLSWKFRRKDASLHCRHSGFSAVLCAAEVRTEGHSPLFNLSRLRSGRTHFDRHGAQELAERSQGLASRR